MKQSGYEETLELAKELLKKLKSKTEWDKDDEIRLSKLTKIVAILTKMVPLEKIARKNITVFDREKDKEIIEHFLECRKWEE